MIPYGRQTIDEDDIAAVVAVLRSDFLTTGPAVSVFEATLARAVGAREAVVCNSGTSALYLAARALGVGEGDTVIVPSMTFLATASAPFLAGAEVVFADVDPDTGLMRPEDLEIAIGEARQRFPDRRLAAAFVVHLAGQCADMPTLRRICDTANMFLIEDACHALGGLTRRSDEAEAAGTEARVGDARWSDLVCFSFHPVKTIAMGEGGAVTTRDSDMADALRLHRNHGMQRDSARWRHRDMGFGEDGTPNPWYYEMVTPGFNFRAPDILCALGTSQIGKLDGFVAARQRRYSQYEAALVASNLPVRPPVRVLWGRPAWHLFAARVDWSAMGMSRAQGMAELRAAGIGTQVHYIPVHRQPFWRDRYGPMHLPGADAYYTQTLSLPLYADMTEADVDRTLAAIKEIAATSERRPS